MLFFELSTQREGALSGCLRLLAGRPRKPSGDATEQSAEPFGEKENEHDEQDSQDEEGLGKRDPQDGGKVLQP
jgi:hypothetical protein